MKLATIESGCTASHHLTDSQGCVGAMVTHEEEILIDLIRMISFPEPCYFFLGLQR